MDFVLCSQLTDVRRNILGLPLGVFTEGHGWWHIFTGLGVYYFIIYNQILSTWMSGRQDSYKLVWHGIFAEVQLQKEKDE
ncbi:hypothetical protein WICPIJ_006439 [Wickerhamomyces pijperi]|nr:hypothetical protein WICPIJ_006439 [Wickerhamomyces pijperi]